MGGVEVQIAFFFFLPLYQRNGAVPEVGYGFLFLRKDILESKCIQMRRSQERVGDG